MVCRGTGRQDRIFRLPWRTSGGKFAVFTRSQGRPKDHAKTCWLVLIGLGFRRHEQLNISTFLRIPSAWVYYFVFCRSPQNIVLCYVLIFPDHILQIRNTTNVIKIPPTTRLFFKKSYPIDLLPTSKKMFPTTRNKSVDRMPLLFGCSFVRCYFDALLCVAIGMLLCVFL